MLLPYHHQILLLGVQSALYIHKFCISGFNQPQIENAPKKKKKKIPESSMKQNLSFPYFGSYLHIIYIVLVFYSFYK